MAALSRIAANIHKQISIVPGDVVIFSSSPIPGNEKSVYRVMNELEQKGARVIHDDTHVSGHACREELKLIYALTKPKYAIPVHGEFRHLKKHKELAVEMGLPEENVKLLRTGDVLTLSEEFFEITDHVPAGGVLVDGLGVGDVGNIVLRDRQHLAENGLIVVAMTLDALSGKVLSGPDIVTRGFVYVRESEHLLEECRMVILDTMEKIGEKKITDWGRIKNAIRDALGEFLWQRTKRSPMILPVLSEIE